MRARRQFRPCFDLLLPRIVPSVSAPAAETPKVSDSSGMPGDDTSVIDNLGDWHVGGDPVDDQTDILHTAVDPSNFLLVDQ